MTSAPLASEGPYGYLMVHFLEDAEGYAEKIYLDLSEGDDPERWVPLNGGEPILASHLSTTGVRDPHLSYNPQTGTYFVLATDLRVFGGDDAGWAGWSRGYSTRMNVWESRDLITWSPLRQIDVARDASGAPAEGAPEMGMMWAAETTFVPDFHGLGQGAFVVYWTSTVGDHQVILWGTTTDFTQATWTFGGILLDQGDDTIDTTMIQRDGRTYRVTKDNGATARGLFMEVTDAERWWEPEAQWRQVQTRIGDEYAAGHGVEGPTMFKAHGEDRWYLYVDVIPSIGYRPMVSTDLDADSPWNPLESDRFSLRASTKHGGVLGLTRDQHEALRAADAASPVEADLGRVEVPVGVTPERIRAQLPGTAEATLHGGGTASFPVRWEMSGVDASGVGELRVEGVLQGTIGANLNAWRGRGGSTAWDAPEKTPYSATSLTVSAVVAVV
ncbi:glycoside hydrolase family 43 protein [Demequina sp. NBRC 110054]|uniref:glycoside hydrolase family 43 protein n=1 Tax=Demequina sp. NBRC 110054 TaxID=1570343 RepID=UPI001356593E|nr:glycoside hydrolase family 43 protein [Demequina sp. NBRC 110054]